MFKFKSDINTNDVDIDIDVVISWFDSTNLKYENINKEEYSFENFRYGNRDTLKYVLRGIYKNIPWVRNIYLITKSQYPEWLDEDKAKSMSPPIIRIDEKDIHPEGKECNGSIAVEACMHRIPNLSNFFIYTNDDMFVCKPMKKNDWMFDNNTGYIDMKLHIRDTENKKNAYWYDNAHIDQIKLFKNLYPKSNLNYYISSHVPTIYNKEIFNLIEDKFPGILKDTQNSKGRILNDLIISRVLAEYISLEKGISVFKKRKYIEYFDYKTNYKDLILNKFTNLFCTNINCAKLNDAEQFYYNFMDSIFPDKLDFES